MKDNILLEKALSTESEQEAISCILMARKKGLKLDSISKSENAALLNSLKVLENRILYIKEAYVKTKQENIRFQNKIRRLRNLVVLGIILSAMLSATVTAAYVKPQCNNMFCVIESIFN